MTNQTLPNNWIANTLKKSVSGNLILILMLFAGIWGIFKLNIQQIPNISIPVIKIFVAYPGASAEDVENSITLPMEKKLRSVLEHDKIYSFSSNNGVTMFVRFESGTDLQEAYESTKKQVDATVNLPKDSEKPIVTRIEPYETIAKLVINSDAKPQELRHFVRQMERQLLDAGIARIIITGLEDDVIQIEVPISSLTAHGLTLPQISQIIRTRSLDAPTGNIGKKTKPQSLRTTQQSRTINQLEKLPIITSDTGSLIRLGDIAKITYTHHPDAIQVEQQGKPVIVMSIQRTQSANTLTSANTLENWLTTTIPTLPKNTQITTTENNWTYISDRISLLLYNGLSGLIIISILLILFLGVRVATWVVIGIPTAFIASFFVLYLMGSTINLISTFAFIMSLGIIVDDAIVVGEETTTQFYKTKNSLMSSYLGASKMFKPVMASSLTTIAAFLPLLLVGGVAGDFLHEIPIVVICVIITSLVECFLILPSHLNHSLKKAKASKNWLTNRFNLYFNWFRDHTFQSIVRFAISYRLITISATIAMILITLGMVTGGRINFQFFPNFSSEVIFANVQFKYGTPQQLKLDYLRHLEKTLWQTNKELHQSDEKAIVRHAMIYNNTGLNDILEGKGEANGALNIELSQIDSRSITNEDFIRAWKQKIHNNPNIDKLEIKQLRGGPPSNRIEIELSGASLEVLNQASQQLKKQLSSYKGALNVVDNLPTGQEQVIYQLTPGAKAIGLTLDEVNYQANSMTQGEIVPTHSRT